MMMARSLVFVVLFYLWSTICGLIMVPLMLGPRAWTMKAMAIWAAVVMTLLRVICAIRVEIRGREYLPTGPALVAAKHQCMFDTMGPLAVFPDACYVMKRELLRIPFYGWYCRKARMIEVDRQGQAQALRKLIAAARVQLTEPRQLIIFPEGTRTPPGTRAEYQPGVAGLYRDLALPCTPMATNSGAHWPAHGFIRRPGVIVYEFLEPIPAGLHRSVFMRELEARLESASSRLLSA